jgi:hypothetical protein
MNFLHSGNVGDVIYSLPTVMALGGGSLYMKADVPASYSFVHPWGNVQLTRKAIDMLLPLVRSQCYIHVADHYAGQSIDANLDKFRTCGINFTSGHLAMMYMHAFPKAHADLSKSWLSVAANTDFEDCIAICRTGRYHGQQFSPVMYEQAATHHDAIFLGLPDEYEAMKRHYPKLKYQPTDDFLEAARIIASCRLYVGNQSGLASIAEGLKVPRVIECCREAHNAFPIGPRGRACLFPEEMAYWLSRGGPCE